MLGNLPLCDARLVQERTATSAADALALQINAAVVPAGKIWVVIGVSYRPSVAETQVVGFDKVTAAGNNMALLNPVSMNLNPCFATCISEGMLLYLLPGEYIVVRRVAATGGSTMVGRMQFVEYDMPLYDYIEPQAAARVVRVGQKLAERVSSLARGGGGGGGGGGVPGGRGRIGPPAR